MSLTDAEDHSVFQRQSQFKRQNLAERRRHRVRGMRPGLMPFRTVRPHEYMMVLIFLDL